MAIWNRAPHSQPLNSTPMDSPRWRAWFNEVFQRIQGPRSKKTTVTVLPAGVSYTYNFPLPYPAYVVVAPITVAKTSVIHSVTDTTNSVVLYNNVAGTAGVTSGLIYMVPNEIIVIAYMLVNPGELAVYTMEK